MAFEECKLCKEPKRHPGCQSTCEYYIKRKKEWDEEKDKIWKAKQEDKLFGGYRLNSVRKAAKRLKNKNRK